MVNLKTLQVIALAGGPICLGSAYYFKRRILRNFQKQDFCTKPIDILHGHNELTERLGTPIGLSGVDLAKKNLNYTNGLEARVAIPLSGKNKKATLHCWSSRPELGSSWIVDKCDIEFDKAEPWTFYLNPTNTKRKLTQDSAETLEEAETMS